MKYDDNMACYVKKGKSVYDKNSVFHKCLPIVADTISNLHKTMTYQEIIDMYQKEENQFLFYKNEIIETCKALIKEYAK